MEIWVTPTHPPLRTYTNSSLASCILVQLSDLCNLGFTVHVQYGITNTCWRHARYWGCVQECIAPPKFPNLQKSPPHCCLRGKQVLKFRKGSSFVRFAPSEGKKLQNFCKYAHIQKIRKRSTFEKFAPSSDKNPWYELV